MKRYLLPFWLILLMPFGVQAFSDVPLASPFYAGITYMTEQNIVEGYEDGSFGIEKPINRAEALKLILTAAELVPDSDPGIDIGESVERKFLDVPPDAWFAKYVSHAAILGIVSGDGKSGNFSPGREVNRAEFIKMMLSSFGVNTSEFTLDKESVDVSSDAWFAPYINFAVKFGVLDQTEKGEALPEKVVSRGEAVEFIFRTLEKGKGLKPQTLLNLTEKHLISTIEFLKTQKTTAAALAVTTAEKFIKKALNLHPENKIVLGAERTSQAMKNLISAYSTARNGQLEDTLAASKNAWNLADEAGQLNPEQHSMTDSIKQLAHALAEKTRKVQKEREEKAQGNKD